MQLTFKHKYLAISLFFAIFSGCSIYWYLEEKTNEIERRNSVEMVSRVVASRLLKAGTRLIHDDLAIRDLPVGYVSQDSFSLDQASNMLGKILLADVRPGEVLTRLHLSEPESIELSSKIDAGYRAITIPVDQINSISGLLKPNDKIDLYVSFDHSGKRLTALLVENISVLATGKSLVSEDSNSSKSGSGFGSSFATVTLSATAEQAVKIVAARQDGKITAVLSGPSSQHSKINKNQKKSGGDLAGLLGLHDADADDHHAAVIYGDLMQRNHADQAWIDVRQQFDDGFETP